jgi:hypothetical protein
MHLKVFVKLKKTLKTLSSGQKKLKKTQKNPKKKQKNPLGWVFFFLNRVFSNPDSETSELLDPELIILDPEL